MDARGTGAKQVRRMSMHDGTETGALRPPLLMSTGDHARLVALAGVTVRRSPLVARLLLEEADRAEVVPAGRRVPTGVIGLGSVAEFRDAATGETRQGQGGLPGEAGNPRGGHSRLSPLGGRVMGVAGGPAHDWA